MKTIIVGGVAGGASVAARLRRLDENAEIVMLERGEFISFANCGLPYYIGDVITKKEQLVLQTPESFDARFAVDVRNFSEVTRIDPIAKTVHVRHRLTETVYQESYDNLVLSPGAEPIHPDLGAKGSEKVFTLRNIPDTYRIKDYINEHKPKSAVIVGGGYIGLEMVENLQKAGLAVTLLQRGNHLLKTLDYDMSCEVENHLKSKGIAVYCNQKVESLVEEGEKILVTASGNTFKADLVLLAIGVTPESRLAKEAGILVNEQGAIVVNDHLESSMPHIYALGDAIEVTHFVSGRPTFIPLAGPANKQGRIVADNICGLGSTYQGTQGTSILKCFDLTIASTGLNEQGAKGAGLAYEKCLTISASHATYYPNAFNLTIKLLFTPDTGQILGAQIIGREGVDKRCDVIATAIRGGMSVYDLTKLELCYAPPYSSAKDPVNMAGFVAENILTKKVIPCDWQEYLDADPEKVTFLDVMTPKEHSKFPLPNTINIPVDSLRQRLAELDKSKMIYVNCMVGLRGYVACRILSQNGFTCKNLSGGYKFLRQVMDKSPQ